ncbi:MAG: hypothetical protein J1E96_02180 [Ruminococcus sp.]|nr:hypothetical protein [Ruminococcus sp.]
MKKIFALIAVVLIAVMSCPSVFAAGLNASEQSVLSNMRTPANMKGNSVYVPSSYINQAEARFNTMDMTADQASRINGLINAGRAFLESTGKKSMKELTSAQLSTIMGYASQAAAVLDVKVPAGADTQNLKIINSAGEVIIDDDGNVIKATGAEAEFDFMPVMIAALTTLLVFCTAGVIVRKKALQYEKEQ